MTSKMPPEIIRLIMSFARPLRPYIHELKYYFVYKNCTMFDEEERPQPYFEDDSEEYSSQEEVAQVEPKEELVDGEFCDCCMGGYGKSNKFGLCSCHCSKCGESASDCRYTCEFYEAAEKKVNSSHEEVILPKIKPVYEKGFLGEIKNWKKEMEYMEWYNSFGITDEDEQRMRDEIFEDVMGWDSSCW